MFSKWAIAHLQIAHFCFFQKWDCAIALFVALIKSVIVRSHFLSLFQKSHCTIALFCHSFQKSDRTFSKPAIAQPCLLGNRTFACTFAYQTFLLFSKVRLSIALFVALFKRVIVQLHFLTLFFTCAILWSPFFVALFKRAILQSHFLLLLSKVWLCDLNFCCSFQKCNKNSDFTIALSKRAITQNVPNPACWAVAHLHICSSHIFRSFQKCDFVIALYVAL